MKKSRKKATQHTPSFAGMPLIGTLNSTNEKILVHHTGWVNGRYLQQFTIFYKFDGTFIEVQDRFREAAT